MKETPRLEYDVVVMGASLAGSCMARQLKLQFPELRIANIEKKTEFDYWVGESTLPPWDDYARRVLGLGRYLDAKHILKHGLRFFFDSPEKDLSIEELSEVGRSRYLQAMPSRQLDRAVFDQDMVDFNRELGVDVHMGTKVLGSGSNRSSYIKIDRDNGHTIETDKGTFVCRWLIDASGRQASMLPRMFGLIEPETRHDVASYWGRFENLKSIDDAGGHEWQHRVAYHSRAASTSHFMYRDYWIWLIPVGHNVDSIGVTIRRDASNQDKYPPLKNADELVAFLKQHQCMRELLGDRYVVQDFGAMARIAHCSKQFFSTDRWFVTGMSGWVIDPLRSLTCAAIARSNQLIGHMIRADKEGREREFESMTEHFNYYMIALYENFLHYLQTYDLHDSWDFYHPYYISTLANAFNKFPAAYHNFNSLKDKAVSHASGCECTLETTIDEICSLNRSYMRIGREFVAALDERGARFANNKGKFADTYFVLSEESRPGLWNKLFAEPDPKKIAEENQKNYELIFGRYLRRLAELDNIPCDDQALKAVTRSWDSGQTLAEALAALRMMAESTGKKRAPELASPAAK